MSFEMTYDSLVGPLGLRFHDGALVELSFVDATAAAVAATEEAAHIRAARDALERYFGDPRGGLTIPVAPHGTPFQTAVWRALQQIPPGAVRTYGALARELNSGPRAVAGACAANPVALAIPCHRVVGRAGLGGYSGGGGGAKGLEIKRRLLEQEGAAW